MIPDIDTDYTPEDALDIPEEQPAVVVTPDDIPVYKPEDEPEGTDIF